MLVKDFMTTIIITAEAESNVVESTKLMAVENIGCLLVTQGDVLAGMVTRKDIVSAQLLSDDVYHSMTLKDIMTSPVVTITPDTDLGQTIALMNQTGKSHIPVIYGDEIIGLVSATDVIRVLATVKLIADGATED
ncbi:MAG: CBS domain-containing protein [Candidatus Thorarchaeota archaeon]|jgi:CBS domain-containing protein